MILMFLMVIRMAVLSIENMIIIKKLTKDLS